MIKELINQEMTINILESMKVKIHWVDTRLKTSCTVLVLCICNKNNRKQVILLEIDKPQIMLAEYWIGLPPKKQFEDVIKLLLTEAREIKKLI